MTWTSIAPRLRAYRSSCWMRARTQERTYSKEWTNRFAGNIVTQDGLEQRPIGLNDRTHGDFGVASLANQPQRGFQDAVPGTRT